jgi:hypothetical protein
VNWRQKTAPLGAVFGVLSTVGFVAFNLVLWSCAKAFYSFESLCAGSFLTFFPPPPTLSQATYFGSSTSDTEIDFSRSIAGHSWRYIVKG